MPDPESKPKGINTDITTDSGILLRRFRVLAMGAVLAVIGGCAGQSETMAEAATVSVTRGAFDPIAVTVQAGDVVTWRNNSVSPQSVTATAFRSAMIPPGGTFSNRFAMAGTYRYTGAGGTPVGIVIVAP